MGMDAVMPASWATDPLDPSRLRYWDGARWTDHVHPTTAAGPPTAGAADPRYTWGQSSQPPMAWGQPSPAPAATWSPGMPGPGAYVPYSQIANPPPRRRNTSLVVSGSISVAIGALLLLLRLMTPMYGVSPLIMVVDVLIIIRGAFWIQKGLRG